MAFGGGIRGLEGNLGRQEQLTPATQISATPSSILLRFCMAHTKASLLVIFGSRLIRGCCKENALHRGRSTDPSKAASCPDGLESFDCPERFSSLFSWRLLPSSESKSEPHARLRLSSGYWAACIEGSAHIEAAVSVLGAVLQTSRVLCLLWVLC